MIWSRGIAVGLVVLAAVADFLTAFHAASQAETVPVRVRSGRRG